MSEDMVKDVENNTVKVDAKKEAYLDKLKKGVLVAFYDEKGKTRSGKAVAINRKSKLVKLVTEYGTEFTVYWDKVLWVKTGKRWPKGVYNSLKGINPNPSLEEGDVKDEQRRKNN